MGPRTIACACLVIVVQVTASIWLVGAMTSRSVSPYLVTRHLLWLVPYLLVMLIGLSWLLGSLATELEQPEEDPHATPPAPAAVTDTANRREGSQREFRPGQARTAARPPGTAA